MRRYHHISQAERRKNKAHIGPSKLRTALLITVAIFVLILMIAQFVPNYVSHRLIIRTQNVSQVSEAVPIASANLALFDPKKSDEKHPNEDAINSVDLHFEICGKVRIDCVVDGDTLWVQGVKIRVADIDTPEISQPKCESEKALGDKAKMRLLTLVNEGPFDLNTIGSRDEDRFGRKLRVLVRDGQSLGDQLVNEGLARTWTGRREPWC